MLDDSRRNREVTKVSAVNVVASNVKGRSSETAITFWKPKDALNNESKREASELN
jgi:hypothetical protein